MLPVLIEEGNRSTIRDDDASCWYPQNKPIGDFNGGTSTKKHFLVFDGNDTILGRFASFFTLNQFHRLFRKISLWMTSTGYYKKCPRC